MGIKFESGKICVVCDQCDNNDFDFHNTENRELHAIKISSVDGREDCQHIETKRDSSLFGNYYDSSNNSSYSFNFVWRVTVNVLLFVLRVVFFM